MMKRIEVERWPDEGNPTRDELERKLAQEDLSFYQWANGPNYRYPAHRHHCDKVIYVDEGSIEFGMPGHGEAVELFPGDRLLLAAGTEHEARVGPEGVVCLEAHR